MLKTSKLLRLHDEILNINSYKVTEHEDIATESTSKLGLSLHIQDDNNEKEKIINYSYLLNDHNKDSIRINIDKKKKQYRYDAFGEKITKDKKRQKVSFIDDLNKYKPIAAITNIESYKKYYNKVKYTKQSIEKENCTCCIIY